MVGSLVKFNFYSFNFMDMILLIMLDGFSNKPGCYVKMCGKSVRRMFSQTSGGDDNEDYVDLRNEDDQLCCNMTFSQCFLIRPTASCIDGRNKI